jgi:hypothetical protein
VFFVFTQRIHFWHLPQIPPCNCLFFFGIHFKSNLEIPITTSNEGYKCGNK